MRPLSIHTDLKKNPKYHPLFSPIRYPGYQDSSNVDSTPPRTPTNQCIPCPTEPGTVERALKDAGVPEDTLLTEKLGHGAFGTVFAVENTEGAVVAVKISYHTHEADRGNRPLHRESELARTAGEAGLGPKVFASEVGTTCTAIIMEHAGTTLDKFLEETPLTVQQRLVFIQQLLQLTHTLHRRLGIAHRDIKPSNIFVQQDKTTGSTTVLLGDYGESSLLKNFSPPRIAGTRIYQPPQLQDRWCSLPTDRIEAKNLKLHHDHISIAWVALEICTGEKPPHVEDDVDSEKTPVIETVITNHLEKEDLDPSIKSTLTYLLEFVRRSKTNAFEAEEIFLKQMGTVNVA
jgi:serine/threonine protein kinase